MIPGYVWWYIYCWMEKALEEGWEESYWFHGDSMILVRVFPRPSYILGIMPLGLEQQRPKLN